MRRLCCWLLIVIYTLLISNFSYDSTNTKTDYQVSISAVPNNGGAVSPKGGKYEEGRELDITATLADSWSSTAGMGIMRGQSLPEKITVNGDKSIKTNFSKLKYDFTVNIQNQGTVDQPE